MEKIMFLLENHLPFENMKDLFRQEGININFYNALLELSDLLKEEDYPLDQLEKDLINNTPNHPQIFELSKKLIATLNKKVVFIPLLPDNESLRLKAIEYVDQHLQFSLNDLKLNDYKDCIDDVEQSTFFSEVIKCMIATDIYAKNLYYKGNKAWFLTGSQYTGTSEYLSPKLLDLEMKLFEKRSRDMDIRMEQYYVLGGEDTKQIRDFNTDAPIQRRRIRYVTCLLDDEVGFLGMIYLAMTYTREKREKIFDVYGIRTTIFGLHKKGVAYDLFNGLFQYAKILNFQLIYIFAFPIGPMQDILDKMGFKDRYKRVDTYDQPNSVSIIDMGCKDKFTKLSVQYYKIEG